MTEEFWNNTENGTTQECTERAQEALEFIVSHGGVTSRWQTVEVLTDAFGPHRAVADFLRLSSLPELRYLELAFLGPNEFDDEDVDAFVGAATVEPLPLFRDPPSKLRTVKVAGLPNPFLFGHSNQLHLPHLTHLTMSFVDSPPQLADLNALLQVTSQLAVLRLNFGMVEPGFNDLDPQVPTVRLAQLREFALVNVKEAFWPLVFFMRLEAPNVDIVEIDLSECEIGTGALVDRLADGGDKTDPRPVFPSVTHLKVSFGENDATALLKTLLHTCPQITQLEIPFVPLDALLVKPWLAPNLQRLWVAGCRGPELRRFVDARIKAKLPLKAVYSDPDSGSLIKSADREYLSGRVEFKFIDFLEGYREVVENVPSEDEFEFDPLHPQPAERE
ncbi:hypothetical protein FRC07_006980 [Ceratobasidium sp. 392]|nr:hypothetical protein FRC07_006980 [Ceratobasidium sp. 392]